MFANIYSLHFKDPEISISASQLLNPPASHNLFRLRCFGAASLVQTLGAEIEISGSLKWNLYRLLEFKIFAEVGAAGVGVGEEVVSGAF